MDIRPFEPGDSAACLAIFDNNTPTYFLPHERDEYRAFLDESDGHYFVGIEAGTIVACGGYWPLPHAPIALLTWGMVDRSHHGRGLGRQLIQYRLDELRKHPEVVAVKLQTSHLSAPFFAKAGFTTEQVIEDGYGPGLHQHDMVLQLH